MDTEKDFEEISPEKLAKLISKKDDRIFLRINHELKQAFAKACQEEGTSMSKVLEQYIIDFLKRKGRL